MTDDKEANGPAEPDPAPEPASEDPGASSNESSSNSGGRRRSNLAPLWGMMFWVLVGAGYLAANWNEFWPWLTGHWVQFAVFAAPVVVVAVILIFRKAWRSAIGQIGSIVFLGIPLIVGLVGVVWAIPHETRIAVLRSVFLAIVIFLPALLYYLFVALRRISLLQEYFINLGRLGLFAPRQNGEDESEQERQVRIVTYLQKFEAIYGAIPPRLVRQIVTADLSPREANRESDAQTKIKLDFHLYQPGLITPEAIPVVVTTLLIGLGWLLVLPPWDIGTRQLYDVLKPTQDPALFAFLGAYFYALQMLFRRFVRRDLRANAYVSISQRIILAVVGVWAVIQVASLPGSVFESSSGAPPEQAGLLVIGFVVGAFPPIAWQVVQAAFNRLTRAESFVPSLSSPMPLRELDGLTVWHEGRLEEEDVENVQNLATANIVELMLNTRYPPDRIVDWVDQAMLYAQLGKHRNSAVEEDESNPIEQLQLFGVRTASSLVAVHKAGTTRGGSNPFEARFADAEGSRIPSLVDALRTNPNLALVQKWNGTNALDPGWEATSVTPPAASEEASHGRRSVAAAE